MEFFNALGNVYSNRKNFKAWEKANEDKNAQREELARKSPKTASELEKARKEGKVLVDVIDIMDTHSEDIAENVETTTAPFEALAPLIALYASTPLVGKFLLAPLIRKYGETSANFRANNKSAVEAMENATKEYISKNPSTKIRPYDVDSSLNMISGFFKRNQLKSIPEVAPQLQEFLKNQAKVLKGPLRKIIMAASIIPAAVISTFVGVTILATKLQVGSSRVARWQSREQLDNEKYFVQYDDKQIEQAKANLETRKNTEGKKSFFDKFKKDKNKPSIIKVIKDNKKYKEWKKTDKDDSKKANEPVPEALMVDAKKDQEVIQRVTKQINNKAEDYSENMETAAQVIFATTPVLGFLVTKPVAWLVEKLGIGNMVGEHNLNKFIAKQDETSQDLIKKTLEALKNSNAEDKVAKGKNNLAFIGAIFDSTSKKGAPKNDVAEVIEYAKKGVAYLSSTQGARGKFITVVGTVVASFAGLLIGLKLQKSSARAGRFVAKREIEQNPQNFVGYSDEELKEVSSVKAEKKSTGQKFKEYITFLPRVIGEYFEYQKYKKTTGRENKELLDELIKLDCSEEQIAEAKNMQKKIFNTFEKVDEGSQQYSESVEAFTTIAKPTVQNLGIIATIATPLILLFSAYKKGKLKVVNIVDGVSTFLAKHTGFLKGKISSKYLDGVGTELAGKVANAQTYMTADSPLVKILDNIGIDKYINEFKSLKAKGVDVTLGDLLENVVKDKGAEAKLINNISNIKQLLQSPDEIAKTLSQITGQELKAKDITPVLDVVSGMLDKAVSDGKISQELIDLTKGLKLGFPEKFVQQFAGAKDVTAGVAKGAYEVLLRKLGREGAEDWKKVLQNSGFGAPIMNQLNRIDLSELDNQKLVKILKNFGVIAENIPSDKLKKILDIALDEFVSNPAKFAALMKNPNGLKNILLTKDAKIAMGIAGGSWFAINFAVVFAIESYLANLQKQAGRLGVMKGLEQLSDPLYYVDTEGAPKVQTAPMLQASKPLNPTLKTNAPNQPRSKALEEYLQRFAKAV